MPARILPGRTGPAAREPERPEAKPAKAPTVPEAPQGWAPKPRTGRAPAKLRVDAVGPYRPVSEADTDGALIGVGKSVFGGATPLSSVPAVRPRLEKKGAAPVLFVNGIRTSLTRQADALEDIADALELPVVGLHNATAGAAGDVLQTLQDKINGLASDLVSHSITFDTAMFALHLEPVVAWLGTTDLSGNLAVASLKKVIHDQLAAGQPVHLVCHSQGALITARAIVEARAQLEAELSPVEVVKAIRTIRVESLGGVATTWPDGPQYVHYVNEMDLVTRAGLRQPTHVRPGVGARIVRFSDDGKGVTSSYPPHSPLTYLRHRVAD